MSPEDNPWLAFLAIQTADPEDNYDRLVYAAVRNSILEPTQDFDITEQI